MFDLASVERPPSPLYDWRPMSTYIRRPAVLEGARWLGERTLKGMRPLAVLPDNITTDHLSPSNAILMDSAAGEYLHKTGFCRKKASTPTPPTVVTTSPHTTRTSANPKLFNEMVKITDGRVKQRLTLPAWNPAKVREMRMWEAIETYMNRKQPLIIIAGADYGQASIA